MIGMSSSSSSSSYSSSSSSTSPLPPANCPPCPKTVEIPAHMERALERVAENQNPKIKSTSDRIVPSFPDTLQNMIAEYGTIPRTDFVTQFDLGVPLDPTQAGSSEVLILYTHEDTFPLSASSKAGPFLNQSALDATKNCQSLKIILQEPHRKNQKVCLAIVPQWESYYVYKFMRLPKGDVMIGGVNDKYPLRYVSRSHAEKGTYARVPADFHTNQFLPVLQEYLQTYQRLLQDLAPVAKRAAGKGKTIVVLVCNWGQAELFHNFVCTARARGLDLSHLLMFATDQQTLELCRKLGIVAFYDETIFADMPERAAGAYGDRVFSQMMMAKVYCVQLVNALGYHVLFQDVDVVWFKDPLPYFAHRSVQGEWDMLFQDDGARSTRYAPFSPNTGTCAHWLHWF